MGSPSFQRLCCASHAAVVLHARVARHTTVVGECDGARRGAEQVDADRRGKGAVAPGAFVVLVGVVGEAHPAGGVGADVVVTEVADVGVAPERHARVDDRVRAAVVDGVLVDGRRRDGHIGRGEAVGQDLDLDAERLASRPVVEVAVVVHDPPRGLVADEVGALTGGEVEDGAAAEGEAVACVAGAERDPRLGGVAAVIAVGVDEVGRALGDGPAQQVRVRLSGDPAAAVRGQVSDGDPPDLVEARAAARGGLAGGVERAGPELPVAVRRARESGGAVDLAAHPEARCEQRIGLSGCVPGVVRGLVDGAAASPEEAAHVVDLSAHAPDVEIRGRGAEVAVRCRGSHGGWGRGAVDRLLRASGEGDHK